MREGLCVPGYFSAKWPLFPSSAESTAVVLTTKWQATFEIQESETGLF